MAYRSTALVPARSYGQYDDREPVGYGYGGDYYRDYAASPSYAVDYPAYASRSAYRGYSGSSYSAPRSFDSYPVAGYTPRAIESYQSSPAYTSSYSPSYAAHSPSYAAHSPSYAARDFGYSRPAYSSYAPSYSTPSYSSYATRGYSSGYAAPSSGYAAPTYTRGYESRGFEPVSRGYDYERPYYSGARDTGYGYGRRGYTAARGGYGGYGGYY
eukprot:NODE_2029_length_783_cov_99.784741_g1619_i0.p2 GENE.NODE_2029_length_783_cov_99.784741_g1619_i0~~NODE_2029_length_783_cov_99.784741_g1619_i0.p2  ORF type:complete len:213 (+),score=22.20 NODE_2029_length_783_cov_99.784741_g1619_i0:57-695(+)